MNRILLVEDDPSLIEGLAFALGKNGFAVDVARTARQALAQIAGQSFDLLLLDVALPDGSGFEICRTVRRSSMVPIIFLTAADEEVNVVMGLELGGDDYITKPFRLNELLARIHALLRRTRPAGAAQAELCSNGIVVRLPENRVFKDAREIELTAAEYRLLCLLMQNPNRVLTREILFERLWDTGGRFVDDNTLSVYIRRLRRKIEDDPENPRFLLTVRGAGYKWNVVK